MAIRIVRRIAASLLVTSAVVTIGYVVYAAIFLLSGGIGYAFDYDHTLPDNPLTFPHYRVEFIAIAVVALCIEFVLVRRIWRGKR